MERSDDIKVSKLNASVSTLLPKLNSQMPHLKLMKSLKNLTRKGLALIN
jgi:hypothetical protein